MFRYASAKKVCPARCLQAGWRFSVPSLQSLIFVAFPAFALVPLPVVCSSAHIIRANLMSGTAGCVGGREVATLCLLCVVSAWAGWFSTLRPYEAKLGGVLRILLKAGNRYSGTILQELTSTCHTDSQVAKGPSLQKYSCLDLTLFQAVCHFRANDWAIAGIPFMSVS